MRAREPGSLTHHFGRLIIGWVQKGCKCVTIYEQEVSSASTHQHARSRDEPTNGTFVDRLMAKFDIQKSKFEPGLSVLLQAHFHFLQLVAPFYHF